MAEYGLTSLGVTVGYGAEETAGTKPASLTTLTRINSIGEISIDSEAIDVSALEDYVTRYKAGRANPSETIDVVVNVTDETTTAWAGVITAYEALTGGKGMWLEIIVPGLTKAFWIKFQPPKKLPVPAMDQNANITMSISLVVNDWDFETKVSLT